MSERELPYDAHMGHAETISPVLPLDSSGRIAAPLPCVHCGQLLQGLSPEGACPECGKPVSDSTRADRLVFADIGWLRRLRWGIMLLLVLAVLYALCHIGENLWETYRAGLGGRMPTISYLAEVLPIRAYQWSRGFPLGSRPFLRFTGLIGCSAACVLIMAPSARAVAGKRDARLARAVLAVIAAYVGLTCIYEVGWRLSDHRWPDQMERPLGAIFFLVSSVLTVSHLARLADRLPARRLAAGLRSVRFVLPALLVVLPWIPGELAFAYWYWFYTETYGGIIMITRAPAPEWCNILEQAVAVLALVSMFVLFVFLRIFAWRLHQTIRLARVIRAAAASDVSEENGLQTSSG